MSTEYKNWHIQTDENKIIWLGFKRHDARVNCLNTEALTELKSILQELNIQKNIIGLVIFSLHNSGFIFGADLNELKTIDNKNDAITFLQLGHEVFRLLENFHKPTLALIKGNCLGGGLELALACTYRICADDSNTRLALPEVKLGLIPGWGGTVRLPRLVGTANAFDIILTGRIISARHARKISLVDYVLPERELNRAAIKILSESKSINSEPNLFKHKIVNILFGKIIKNIAIKKLRTKAAKKHYPAPYCFLENFNPYNNKQAALDNEIKLMSDLAMTDTAKNLLRVFFLQEAAKSKIKHVKSNINHIHVVGAGTMGADIAAFSALKGFYVTISDLSLDSLAKANKKAYKLFKKKLKAPHLVTKAMDRFIPDISGKGITNADLIIEAISENLEIKQKMFNLLMKKAKTDVLFATNTSTIPLNQIRAGLNSEINLLGIHFFNPVPQMQLVEIVHDQNVTQEAIAQASMYVKNLGKIPVQVKSSLGFLVNRILMPYLMESMKMLDEGIAKEAIDKAATDFGMPMGPIQLVDVVGLDVCLSVAKNLVEYFDAEIPRCLQQLVDDKHLGVKTGSGFYQYATSKPIKKTSKELTDKNLLQQITDRLVNAILIESAACMQENIIATEDELDLAMIFGTGFPPFLGGPMHYKHQA